MPDETTPPEPAAPDTGTPPPAEPPSEPTPPAKPEEGPKSMLEAIDAGIAASGDGPKPEPKEGDEDAPEPKEPAPAKEPAKEPAKTPGKEPAKPEPDKPEPAAAKPKKPAEPKEPPAPLDPVNDPIGAEVKGRTRERMTQLITTVKDISAQRDQAVGERDEILGMIQETGATAEQYGQALEYLAAVNSRDPARIKQAISVAQRELAALASMIGEPVPGVDMLAQHPDLQAEVADGKLTQARAQEIAAARALRVTRQEEGQRYTQMQALQRAEAQGRQALNRVEAELRRADPDYERKKALLVPVLKPIMDSLPPAQWERAFRAAYAEMQLPAMPPAPLANGHANGNGAAREPMRASGQPMRAMQPAGNARREASSMLDAINEGIEAGSRRR